MKLFLSALSSGVLLLSALSAEPVRNAASSRVNCACAQESSSVGLSLAECSYSEPSCRCRGCKKSRRR